MEIIQTIILIGAWIFTIIWMYGVRVKPVVVSTSLVSLSILLTTLTFTFLDIHSYHLLWMIPIVMFVGARVFVFITLHIPILNKIFIGIGKIYTEILRVGVSRETKQKMLGEYKEEMGEMLHDLMDKKQKEINENK